MNDYIVLGVLSSKSVEPQEFLRYCFSIDHLPLDKILETKKEFQLPLSMSSRIVASNISTGFPVNRLRILKSKSSADLVPDKTSI